MEPRDPQLAAWAAARARSLDELELLSARRKRRRPPVIGVRFLLGMLFGLVIAWYVDGRISIVNDCVEISPECDAPAPAGTGWL